MAECVGRVGMLSKTFHPTLIVKVRSPCNNYVLRFVVFNGFKCDTTISLMTYMCHKSLSCEFCDITSHNCRFFDIPMDILPKIGSSADSEFYGTIVSASPPGHWFVFSILQIVTKVK